MGEEGYVFKIIRDQPLVNADPNLKFYTNQEKEELLEIVLEEKGDVVPSKVRKTAKKK